MKKDFVKGFIASALLFSSINVFATNLTAIQATFPVLVNNKVLTTDKPIVTIDGSTYLPLKVIGEALNVKVLWNSELKQVEIGNTSSEVSTSYIGNNNTMKLHLPNCSSIKDISESNKIIFNSKEEAINYTPCKICNP